MDGIYYLLVNASICVIVLWYAANERFQTNSRTSGLLAMVDKNVSKTRLSETAFSETKQDYSEYDD
ncbi:hypothetical protein CCP2SC5_220005 [Azospirillaceae bacterium]